MCLICAIVSRHTQLNLANIINIPPSTCSALLTSLPLVLFTFSTCILRCPFCIVVSCLVCIVVVVLCVLLSSYVCLLYYLCIAVFVLCVLLSSYVCLLYYLCIAVFVLCVLLSSYVCLLYYLCIAVLSLDAGLLARSQYPEGPATGNSTRVFLGFPVSISKC